MNLTRLFNFKYFLENIKKSKSIIVFLMFLLPTFTIINLLGYSSNYISSALRFDTLNTFNYFFMYIIPIALSISLFDFVYKRVSADFIGSMPISRKSIFVTNTVFGIILLVVLQAFVAIITAIMAQIFGNVIIFGSMIWDSFVYFSVGYIFVFVVSNLAVSFTGNVHATIATTALIVFLIPFTLYIANNSYSYYYERESNNRGVYTFYEEGNYTIPSAIFDMMAGGEADSYNLVSIIKTGALSILYFFIGFKIFQRKKYEMAEESFETDKTHLIIKALTLAPFMAIASQMNFEYDWFEALMMLVIVAVYFVLFDVITKKKIKFKTSVSTFVLSVVIMYSFYAAVVPKLNIFSKRLVNISEDIENVELVSMAGQGGYTSYLNLIINDKDIISDIFKADEDYGYKYGGENYKATCNFIINTKFGGHFKLKRYGIDISKVIEKYGDRIFELRKANYEVYSPDVRLKNSVRKDLVKTVNSDLRGITLKEYIDIISNDGEFYEAYLVTYYNHELIYNDVSYVGLKETTAKLIKLINDNITTEFELGYQDQYRFYDILRGGDLSSFLSKMNPNIKVGKNNNSKIDNLSELVNSAARFISADDLSNFISSHKGDAFDRSKPYFVLRIFMDKNYYYYSNDIEGFYKLMASAYNNSKTYDNIVLTEDI